MIFIQPYRLSEVTIQAEIYLRCKKYGIKCYLGYKYNHSIFDVVIIKDKNIIGIIETKSYYSLKKEPNYQTKQIKKYLKYNLPVLVCGRIEQIDKTLETIQTWF